MSPTEPRPMVLAVCIGTIRSLAAPGGPIDTAIDKRPVDGVVEVVTSGLTGDQQADPAHGSTDQAVYAYAQQDADHWRETLDRPCPPGVFGENLRVAGLDLSGAPLGQRWAVGDRLLVEVTAPRIPCRAFAAFWDLPDLVATFLAAGRPGAYLRVLVPGPVAAGDPVTVVDTPDHAVTVADAMRIRTRDRFEAERLLAADRGSAGLLAWARDATRSGPARPEPGAG